MAAVVNKFCPLLLDVLLCLWPTGVGRPAERSLDDPLTGHRHFEGSRRIFVVTLGRVLCGAVYRDQDRPALGSVKRSHAGSSLPRMSELDPEGTADTRGILVAPDG
jgi:hypothetical protein